MIRAICHGVVVAEAAETIRLEGNHYFAPESVHREYLRASRMKSLCPWKGLASYYTITVGDVVDRDGAWYYPHPSPLARRIRNHVAFGPGVIIDGTAEPDGNPDRTERTGQSSWWRPRTGRRT